LLGWLIAQEDTVLPWMLIGVDTFVMYILVWQGRWASFVGALGLSFLHGTLYVVVFNQVKM
jgi:hypothetical protein